MSPLALKADATLMVSSAAILVLWNVIGKRHRSLRMGRNRIVLYLVNVFRKNSEEIVTVDPTADTASIVQRRNVSFLCYAKRVLAVAAVLGLLLLLIHLHILLLHLLL